MFAKTMALVVYYQKIDRWGLYTQFGQYLGSF